MPIFIVLGLIKTTERKMPIIDVYDRVRRINVVLPEYSVPNWNPIMNQNHFRIQKGTKNYVEFQVRNNDRKPINLLDKTLVCNVNYPDGHANLIQKKLHMVDPLKGIVALVLLPNELMNWPLGSLSFNITSETPDGFSRMLYVTESDRTNGWLYVDDGPYLGPMPTIKSGLYKNMSNNTPVSYTWYSDILPGSNRAFNNTGTMTAVITTDLYSGTISAFGSLEESMPQFTDEVWFNLNINDSETNTMVFDHQTGNILLVMTANVNWVMFSFVPTNYDPNQAYQDASTAFDLNTQICEIQFRNA